MKRRKGLTHISLILLDVLDGLRKTMSTEPGHKAPAPPPRQREEDTAANRSDGCGRTALSRKGRAPVPAVRPHLSDE